MIDVTEYGKLVKNVLGQIFSFLGNITIKFGDNEVSVLNMFFFILFVIIGSSIVHVLVNSYEDDTR